MRHFVSALALGALVGCNDAGADPHADAGTEFTRTPVDKTVIPFVVSLTGTLQGEGAEQRRGALVAQQQLNALGGVLGKPVEIELLDDRSDPEAARELVSAFAGAPIVLGPTGSPAAVALRNAAPEQLFLSPSATSPVVDEVIAATPFYRTAPSDKLQAKGISLLATTSEDRCFEMSIVYSDDDYGRPIAENVKLLFSLSNKVVAMLPVASTLRDSDYYQRIADSVLAASTRADGNSCQLVATPATVAAEYLRAFRRSAESVGPPTVLTGFKTYGAGALRTDEFLTASRQDPSNPASASVAEGIQVVAPETEPEGTNYSAYRSLYLAQFPNDPIGRSANAYDAVIVAALALQAAGPDASAAAVQEALLAVSKVGTAYGPGKIVDALLDVRRGADIDYTGATGSLDFDNKGQVLSDVLVWKIESGGFHSVGRYRRSDVQN